MDFAAYLVFLSVGIALGYLMAALRGKQALAGAVPRKDYDTVLQEKIALETKVTAASELKKELEDKLEVSRQEGAESRDRAITAEANSKALADRLREQEAQMKLEFKNTATGLLEQMGTRFNAESEKHIGELLNPLRQHLSDFQKLVGESFSAQGKEQHSLRAEIQKIVLQADNLTKALRGDAKAQGNWGEIMLERILEASGLKKGIGYVIQATEMDLVGADGNRLRPDVIVHLPEGKHIIIDSKVSLSAYDRYCNATDELTRQLQLKEFLKSVRNHANELAAKNYAGIKKLDTPDLVLMFMPIEGAYSLAVQEDQELHPDAWEKRVAIVCPSTLFTTLKTIASLWRIEAQNRHADEIAQRGGLLYDKFHGFITDMQSIGEQMNRMHKVYETAMNKLSAGRGSVISQVESLKKLGAKASKSLPRELLQDEDNESLAALPELTTS